MDTVTAVRNRILQLCGEHEININTNKQKHDMILLAKQI